MTVKRNKLVVFDSGRAHRDNPVVGLDVVSTSLCLLAAATIVQNKAVARQGLEEGEEEENRGTDEVEDMGLGWMEACCMALDLHAAEPAVQVSPNLCRPT